MPPQGPQLHHKNDLCKEHGVLVTTIEIGFETLTASVKNVGNCVEDIKKRLFVGDGEGNPAMTVRLDRLEQQQKSRNKIWWLIAGAVVVVTINGIWSLAVKLGAFVAGP